MSDQLAPPTNVTAEDLTAVAMQIIILAGDARKLIFDAADASADNDFERTDSTLSEAHKKVQEAHRIHTDQIQSEASGVTLPYSMLFAHAQDTLMTVNSEYRVMRKTLAVLRNLESRIARLEGGRP